MKRIPSAVLPVVLLVWLVPATQLRCAAAGERPAVRVGVCLSLSGDFGEYGRTYLPGVQLAAEAHNADPGRAFDIELVVRDDASSGSTAAAAVRDLADNHGVVAVIGSCASGVTLSMRDETAPRRLAMISPSATNSLLGRDNDGVVRVLFDDEFQGTALARYSREKLGFSRAAVMVNIRHEYSKAIGDAFATHFTQSGGSVHRETYDGSAADMENYDFRPLLRRIEAAGAQTVVISSYSADIVSILRQSQELGLSLRFCGGDAWYHQETLLAAGNALEGAYYTGVMDVAAPTEQNRRFRRLLDGTNLEADAVSAQGYDAMLILFEALKAGASREDVFEGVYSIRDLPLVTGSLTVSRDVGSLAAASITEIRKNADGMFVGEIVDTVKP